MFHYFEKNFLKISIFLIAVLSVGFLVFSYFYFSVAVAEYEFISLFISEANLYPNRVLPAENIVSKHSKKTQQADINFSEIKDIFIVFP